VEPKVFLLVVSFLIASFLGAAVAIAIRGLFQRRRSFLQQQLAEAESAGPQLELSLEPDFAENPGPLARFEGWFYRLIGETGIGFAPDAAMLMAVACGLVVCGVLLLWRDDFLAAAVGLVAGILMVIMYFVYRRGRRRAEIQDQLPDVMDLLSRAVRAGESLDQAMTLVGSSTSQPLGPEFQRCARQLEMGLSVNAAMRSLVRRMPLPEIRIMASTLVMQRRTGGSLSVMLDRLSRVVRDRINYHRQFRAATGAGRISTIMIGAAGPLVAIYMLTFQRDYFNRFFETYGGNVMLATAIALQVIGLVWIYSLLRSDY
jgi:tight adherence protein B